MTMLSANRRTLADAILPQSSLATDAALVVGASLFVALSAQISIPLTPVPITGQTLAVLLTGALLGWRRAGLAMLLYLAEGALGLPVFAASATLPNGWGRLVGPTGGYLVSYPFAAALVGWLAERGWDRKLWTAALAMVFGNVVIYLFGAPWLMVYTHNAASAVLLGIKPFLLGDALKIALATLAMPGGWALVKRIEDRR